MKTITKLSEEDCKIYLEVDNIMDKLGYTSLCWLGNKPYGAKDAYSPIQDLTYEVIKFLINERLK